jgi:cytochrome c-type biogenesis protein CcmH
VIARLLLALVALVVLAAPVRAAQPDEMLADPALEQRAENISKQLRCVVCQNQTIDDSNAPLAHDMRLLVRERLAAGDSDRDVVNYIVARYGNFVLLKPPFQADTWALWLAPFVVLVLAVSGVVSQLRRTPPPAPAPLTAEESRRLRERLGSTGGKARPARQGKA